MNFSIIKPENNKTNNWAGGTTTELFIFPPTADYQQRNFDFRLSTATVEIEKSDFTPLQGVSRNLMVLEGEMTLHHENHHSKQLGKFDVDKFEGGWNTSSIGKCADLNLMTIGNTKGELDAVSVEEKESIEYQIRGTWNWVLIYIFEGKVSVDLDNKTHILNQGDLLALNEEVMQTFPIKGIESSELIFSKITI